MKLLWSILFCLFTFVLGAQTFKDSVFEKVISIDKENTTRQGKDFLLDAIVPDSVLKISFLNGNPELPNAVICNSRYFFPQVKEFFIISRDWDYYKRIAESNKNNPQRHLIPIQRFKYFHVKRNYDNIAKIDSFTVDYEQPKLNLIKFEQGNPNEIKVFYTERYGSDCCPRDLLWDNNPGIADFVPVFEKENNVVVRPYYHEFMGFESEINFYFPLEYLSAEQKLKFIVERLSATVINRERKDFFIGPRVFTPVMKDRRKLKD